MTFIPQTRTERPILENPEAKILIVGDCPTADAIKLGKPFAGPCESVLQAALHHAGLTSYDVSVTNLIFDDTNLDSYWRDGGAKGSSQLKKSISGYSESLIELVVRLAPEVVVPLGELTMYALTGRSAITKLRGYPVYTGKMNLRVVPSLHPRKMTWSNYVWRYYLGHDLRKAAEIAENPKLMHPEVICNVPETFSAALFWLDHYASRRRVSIDIEVSNFEVSCIGFSDVEGHGTSIPLDERWTVDEECELWRRIANIFENPEIEKIGQNYIFDIHFVAQRMGIYTKGKITDTMMGHSIMWPDFLKGLNFLGSIYTKHPYWKDEMDHKTIKENS